ncbi:MAG: hypothetical protein AB7F59_09275 [Bdellovibrionales bacterium]
MKHFLKLSLVATSLFWLAGCSPSPQNPTGSAQPITPSFVPNNQIQVISGGVPVAQAKILIGMGNQGRDFLMTDENGLVTIPAYWTNAEHVTIEANGFIRATYLNQMPTAKAFTVHLADIKPTIEVKGNTTQFQPYIVEKDGIVDFALVLPLVSTEDMLFFNENSVLSTEMDYISIFGQRMGIPSNISVPVQKEKYGLFTFTLNKPLFRFKVARPGNMKLLAARGRASLGALKDRLPPNELINQITIAGGGVRATTVASTGGQVDIPVNELNFNQKLAVTAPQLPQGTHLLAVPLIADGALRYPSDVKSLKPMESRQLTVAAQGASELATIISPLDRTVSKAASAALVPVRPASQALKHLGLPAAPTVANNQIQLSSPTIPAGVMATGLYMTKSAVTLTTVEGETIETIERKWEVYGEKWDTAVTLPVLPETHEGKSRWEASFLARDQGVRPQKTDDARSNLFNQLNYVSRNSVDL